MLRRVISLLLLSEITMTWHVKNWNRFQHFKDRRPPWIKLYREILEDPDWHDLDGENAKGLTMLWLIASEKSGELPDARKLAFRLRKSETEVKQLLNALSHWLEQDDITPISSGYQHDAPEREGETEAEAESEKQEPIQEEGNLSISQRAVRLIEGGRK
jgi:hypothetical protein